MVGQFLWFEYHCLESIKSCDAELWYRSHQKVFVNSIVEFGAGDTINERLMNGEPRVYNVTFSDGYTYDVFEDELFISSEYFQRPPPPILA